MRLTFLPLFFLIFNSGPGLFAQEKDSKIRYNVVQAERYAKEKTFAPRESRGGGSLSLPFFDDFSRYSLPTNDPTIPTNYQHWLDTTVFINTTFPISPFTIGVATLDGLRSNGMPYVDTLYFPSINDVYLDWGLCDSLTSMPIDLSGYLPEDNVFLAFSYECGGRGNQPDADGILGALGDSLVLEFFSPLQEGQWFRVWEVQGGINANVFDTAFVRINQDYFLQDGFQFRFKNYCTQHGALDHWHLDYVTVESNFDSTNVIYDEVSMQYANNTLLNFGYTSMPWTHFLANPELYMAPELTYYQRNLGIADENIASRWSVSLNGVQQIEGATNVDGSDNAQSELITTVSLEDYTYEAPGTLDSATFDVCVYFNQTDAHLQNDTACFEQRFTNYYAYDDGTAERAYGIQSAGGKVAMKFQSEITDTLIGVYMYFIPVQYLASDQSFIVQVWEDVSGQPGELLTSELDNFNFSLPQYRQLGPNSFSYYELTDPIEIPSGNFYVGYIQQSDVSLNMGLDKNTSSNSTKLFYQLQGISSWSPSSIEGSMMIRPVFRSGLPEWVGLDETTLTTSEFFPNPTSGELSFNMKPDHEMYSYQISDVTGRIIASENFVNNGLVSLNVSTFENASYIIRIISQDGERSIVKHFIKN